MSYICVYKYENTELLGVSFQKHEPAKNPAPGVHCVLYGPFSGDEIKQAQVLDYLNSAFPGNGKNLFATKVQIIEKLIALVEGYKQTQGQSQALAPAQQPQAMHVSGYIVPRPTRNDDSEYSRTPVSSFSYANHAISMPQIQQNNELTFGRHP